MSKKLLAILVAGILAGPAALYAQDAPKKDSGMTKDRPAATRGKDSPGPVGDTAITTRIKSAYVKDKLVRAKSIRVDTEKGVVRLTGKARSKAEADRAEEIAKNTKGVVSVKNDIEVQPPRTASSKERKERTAASDTPKRDKMASSKDAPKKDSTASRDKDGPGVMDDAAITTKIKTEYAKDKLVSATKIKVDTNKGVVQLSGVAKSKAEADKAAEIAKNTKGVTSVKNDIKVETK
jgi:osmotically-inducible protein OsmY